MVLPLSSTAKTWSPDRVSEAHRTTLLSALVATAAASALLWRPIAHMSEHIWGPPTPWTNGDFLGAYWLFWAVTQPENWVSTLHWPYGELSIWQSFPNPFDALVLGPLMAHLPFPSGWNGMLIGHHLANIVATVVLARAAGVRGPSAALAGALVGASPVMLFEIGLGHTLTAAVWPGLFGLALLLRGHGVRAGVLIGVQGLFYLYAGLGFGLVALLVRPHRGLLAAVAVVGPYLWFLLPQLPAAQSIAPPAGHTGMPLSGLLWSADQYHFRSHPMLLIGFLAPILCARSHRPVVTRWIVVAMGLLFIAIGPQPAWIRGTPLFTSPLSGLLSTVPGLGRMHHPIRFIMLLIPLLGVLTATIVDRWPRWVVALSFLLVIPTWQSMDDAVGWRADPTAPGAQAARWVADRGTAIVDLGSRSMEGLALQPIHRLPLMAGFHPRNAPPPHLDPTVFRRVNAWADGQIQPGLPTQLRALGFSHVLAIDRGPAAAIDVGAVESQLGTEVFPGVYAL